MLCAHAMVDATEPILQVAEDEVDDRHELFGHLGVAAFGNRVVITGRGESTIRSHVKHMFARHGLSRQAELVRLVLSLAGAPETRR